MKMSTIEDITNFIFVGKNIDELSYYDLLIINADWAEEKLAKDIRIMFDRNIIDKDTLFIICESHQNNNRSNMLINYLKKENINNKIIVDNKYITNHELLKNIDKLVNVDNYTRILRIAKDFVARRWFMNARKYNFPIDKCDFFGVVDNRNISKNDWYKSEAGINQVMKEFINIGELTINNELSIK